MSSYLIPIIILSLLLYSIYKKVNVYECFVFGAKKSMQLVVSTLPYVIAIFILIEMFSASGLNNVLSHLLAPILRVFGIPQEISGLIIIKPFSGSGSIAMLENIITKYGTSSYITKCACVTVGSSEAVFYVSSVYFAKTKVCKFGIVIPIALLSNFIGIVVGCNAYRLL